MTPTTRLQLTYVLPAVVLLALLAPRLWGAGTEAVLPYSQFQQLLAQDKVKQVVTVRTGIEYMTTLAEWYTNNATDDSTIGFFQIGGGIAGDFPPNC